MIPHEVSADCDLPGACGIPDEAKHSQPPGGQVAEAWLAPAWQHGQVASERLPSDGIPVVPLPSDGIPVVPLPSDGIPVVPIVSVGSGESAEAWHVPFEYTSGAYVRWQWEHKTGWRDYRPDAQEKIEQAYRRGESKARLKAGKVGSTPMEIFFADRVQYDPITKNKRNVQRLGPWPTSLRLRRMFMEIFRAWENGKPIRETSDHYQRRREELVRRRTVNDEFLHTASVQSRARFAAHTSFGRIVRSAFFFPCSMLLVLLNAIWIAVETDHNEALLLADAPVGFQIVEHAFCAAFTLELLLRWCAYERKGSCLQDPWFRFDFLLVLLMVLETWILPVVLKIAGVEAKNHTNLGNLSILRLARLLRLSRITRLLRSAPEVVILLKGVATAFRSVMVTMVLLCVLLYVFGVAFTSQGKDYPSLEQYFGNVPDSMWTLLLHGTLLDEVSRVLNEIKAESASMTMVFCSFIFLSNCTVMNMLIGILCDVVSRVKDAETERSERAQLHRTLREILECYDFNNNETLCKNEFTLLMENPEVVDVLMSFGTDVGGLLTLSDIVFDDVTRKSARGNLSFDEFLDLVMRLKGAHNVRVTDVVEQREYTRQRIDRLEKEVRSGQREIKEAQASLLQQVEPLAQRSPPGGTDIVMVRLSWQGQTKVQRRMASVTVGELLRQLSLDEVPNGRLVAMDFHGVEFGPELSLGDLPQSSPGSVDLFLEIDAWQARQSSSA